MFKAEEMSSLHSQEVYTVYSIHIFTYWDAPPRRMPVATGRCSFLVEIVYKPSLAAVAGRAKGEDSIIDTLEVQRPYRK